MESNVTATYIAKNLSDVLNRVKYKGEEFVVQRNGEPVCRIVPLEKKRWTTFAELADLWARIPKPDPGYWDDLEDIIKNQPPMPESPWER